MFRFLGYRVYLVLFRVNRYDLEIKGFSNCCCNYLTGSSVSFSWRSDRLFIGEFQVRKVTSLLTGSFPNLITFFGENCLFQIRIAPVIYAFLKLVSLLRPKKACSFKILSRILLEYLARVYKAGKILFFSYHRLLSSHMVIISPHSSV